MPPKQKIRKANGLGPAMRTDRDVAVELLDGRQEQATLARPLNPEENSLEVILVRNGKTHTYSLSEICSISMPGTPSQFALFSECEVDEVETVTGKRYCIRILDPHKHQTGFYGFDTNSENPLRLLFFTLFGVRERRQARFLGKILEEEGLVGHGAVEDALRTQEELRTRRVGEIIADHNNLPQEAIEKTLENAMKKGYVPPRARVGDILIAAGLVTREQVEKALATQEHGKKKKVGELLIDSGLITERQLLAALATKFRMRWVDLETLMPSPDALMSLPVDLIHRMQVLPIEVHPHHIVVATSEPTNPMVGDTLRFYTSCGVELVVATADQIAAAVEKYYGKSADAVQALIGEMSDADVVMNEELDDSQLDEADSQVITLVNRILIDAYLKGISDVHFEPSAGTKPLQVRYRMDGECHIEHQIPATYKYAVISRIKIISKLDIAERRRPQSGKILMRYEGRKIEYRVEITPTVGGHEDAVLRVLSNSRPLRLEEAGFAPDYVATFQEIITKPYGIVLCVGPTGSGKTTTLHSALAHINTPQLKIWTAEDPVEITQPGLRQVQVYPKIGFTFQEALRSFLRSDPDVIMVGEMRDRETAKTAIEASLTGHLVFSTLHTNSAPETAVRLIEMGMDPFTFSDALLGILAQRLARKLCDRCKEPYQPDQVEVDRLAHLYDPKWFGKHGLEADPEKITLMRKVGCETCGGTGYRGRIAVHELLVGTESMKAAIKKQAPAERLRKLAMEDGMRTLKMDGIRKVLEGLTDLSQVLRVCL